MVETLNHQFIMVVSICIYSLVLLTLPSIPRSVYCPGSSGVDHLRVLRGRNHFRPPGGVACRLLSKPQLLISLRAGNIWGRGKGYANRKFRILKCRYCTNIRPYFVGTFPSIGLICGGGYLKFRFLKWPLNRWPSSVARKDAPEHDHIEPASNRNIEWDFGGFFWRTGLPAKTVCF